MFIAKVYFVEADHFDFTTYTNRFDFLKSLDDALNYYEIINTTRHFEDMVIRKVASTLASEYQIWKYTGLWNCVEVITITQDRHTLRDLQKLIRRYM